MVKTYLNLQDLFADGIFAENDILIFWGKRGRGKSSLAGFFMGEFMKSGQARRDVALAHNIADKLKNAGILISPPSDHTVFCDTFFEQKHFLRKSNSAYTFDPLRFGLPNEIHETDPICPCGRYFFDEAQDVFDSHVSALPTFVTKAFELGRQINMFAGIIAQRPKRIHIDIRDIATFIECCGIEKEFSKYGRIKSVTWTINIIYENGVLENYLTTRDSNLIDKTIKIKADWNIFNCYDTNYFLPMYYREIANKENKLFVYEKSTRTEFDEESFSKFFSHRVIDIPETYRGKKPKDERTSKEINKKLTTEIETLKKIVTELARHNAKKE